MAGVECAMRQAQLYEYMYAMENEGKTPDAPGGDGVGEGATRKETRKEPNIKSSVVLWMRLQSSQGPVRTTGA